MDKMNQKNETLADLKDVDHYLNKNKEISFQESQNLYKKWAEQGTYDKMCANNPKDYKAIQMFGSGMDSLFKDKTSVKVLDVGAGTGLSGEKLRSLGFVNVDGLEPCGHFVKESKQKGIYNHIHESPIGGDTPLGVQDDTYDALCTVGSFGPGHIPCSGIPEMVRIVKPGGYILICLRLEFLENTPEYKNRLVPLLETLEGEGRIKKLDWTIYPDHIVGKEGLRMIFQVL